MNDMIIIKYQKIFILIYLLIFISPASAVILRADRPEFTLNTDIIPAGQVQSETGYTYTKKFNENEHKIGEINVRLGLISSLEWIFGINSYRVAETEDKTTSGKDDPSIALKIKLVSSPNRFVLWEPNMAILMGTMLPTGKSETDTRQNAFQPLGKIIISWPLNRIMELGTNLNYSYKIENNIRFSQPSGGVSLRLNYSGIFSLFTEYYGYRQETIHSGRTDYIKGGIIITPLRIARIDIYGGRGLTNTGNNKYIGAGIVFRYQ